MSSRSKPPIRRRSGSGPGSRSSSLTCRSITPAVGSGPVGDSTSWSTPLALQPLQAREKLLVSLIHLASRFIRGRGLGTDQGLRAAAALGHMRQITAVALDDPMQMLPAILAHAKTVHRLIGVVQKGAQLPAVIAVARQLRRAAIIRGLYRLVLDARGQLGPACRQPVRDRAAGLGRRRP